MTFFIWNDFENIGNVTIIWTTNTSFKFKLLFNNLLPVSRFNSVKKCVIFKISTRVIRSAFRIMMKHQGRYYSSFYSAFYRPFSLAREFSLNARISLTWNFINKNYIYFFIIVVFNTKWGLIWHQGKNVSDTPEKTTWCHVWHNLKEIVWAKIMLKWFLSHVTTEIIHVNVLK